MVNLASILEDSAAKHPDRTAVVFGDQRRVRDIVRGLLRRKPEIDLVRVAGGG